MAFCIHGYLASQSLVQDGLSATGELALNRLGGHVPQKDLANNVMGQKIWPEAGSKRDRPQSRQSRSRR